MALYKHTWICVERNTISLSFVGMLKVPMRDVIPVHLSNKSS